MTRRDRCHLIGRRASKLSRCQRANAWHVLAHHLLALGDTDMPKFRDLARAIRKATIAAKNGSIKISI